MSQFKTEQEIFWAGEFGNEYIKRNSIQPEFLASYTAMWSKILSRCSHKIESILELGANVGLNMHSIKYLLPTAKLSAVEINSHAAAQLRASGICDITEQSILDFTPEKQWDFVFTAGVLIHINPESLSTVYNLMRKASLRYICICEYYNPTPVEVSYRGHSSRLFKRDFAGEFLDTAPEYRLVDYGFIYHRDNFFPIGDTTWFLLEK